MRRQCRVVTGGMHHGRTVLEGQTAQGQLRGIGLLKPCWTVARTVRGQQQNSSPRETLDERCQVILGRVVDPTEILDFDNQGALLTAPETHLLEDVKGAGSDRFGR